MPNPAPKKVRDYAIELLIYVGWIAIFHFVGAPDWAAIGFALIIANQYKYGDS